MQRKSSLILSLACLGLVGCSEPTRSESTRGESTRGESTWEATPAFTARPSQVRDAGSWDMGDAQATDAQQGCNIQTLSCDAIYHPTLEIRTFDQRGFPLCVEGTTVHASASNGQEADTTCRCDQGSTLCWVDLTWGDSSHVTLRAPGYRPVEYDLSIPCWCHPRYSRGPHLVPQP
jgi:hypothetical protein